MGKNLSKFILLMVLILTITPGFAQTNIIFDTDFGGDADDLGALVMLHHFVDKGECNLVAVMCWSTEQYAVPAIDAVNRFYNHPQIPIGTRKADTYYEPWNYCKPIADAFYHEMTHEKATDVTLLYRQLLSKSKDKSITIVVVGPLKNIELLLKSKADSISDFTGEELIQKKVKEFVVMGGQFPSGEKEWNFDGNMPGVTKFVIEKLKVPITFSGYEVGVVIKTGEIFNNLDPKTPLYVGFLHFSNHAPWMKEFYNGKIINNATYDQTAVLYAVRNGIGTYWSKVMDGYCLPDSMGGNKWIQGVASNQGYLKLLMPPEKMALLIESLMLNDFK